MQNRDQNASPYYCFSKLFLLTITITLLTMTTSMRYKDDNSNNSNNCCVLDSDEGTGANADAGADRSCQNEASSVSIFVPRLKELLRESVNALSPSTPFGEKDETAVATLIFESMYTPGRVYHSMQHVFNITENCDVQKDSILLLSTLFHDVIYYTVDKSFQEPQLEFLDNVLVFENADGVPRLKQPLVLAPNALEDPLLDMVFRLFGFEPGTPLPSFGSNEFLSAVIGVRVLSKFLNMPQLTQLAAAIEATIPFRPASSDGKTAMDRLYDRLVKVAPNQSKDWLVETIHLSANMANCDLCSFGSSDFDFFLDSNWSLVPEFRPSLLKEVCPLREYYDEFLAMEGRTKFLVSAIPNIFQVFRNTPSDGELTAKRAKTHANLNLGNDYAEVRRLQLMVLMEIITIVGENPDSIPGRPFLSVEMPKSRPSHGGEDGNDNGNDTGKIRKLLDQGRRESFLWDPPRCSLGAFLYDKLGKEGIETAVEIGKTAKSGSYNYDLLKHLPKDIVTAIASSLGGLLPNRTDELLQISDQLGRNSGETSQDCISME